MGLIKNQSSYPLIGNRADRMLVPKQAKTQVSIGGIHKLPVVTRWAQLQGKLGQEQQGLGFLGKWTGCRPGRGSWACRWGSDKKSLLNLSRTQVGSSILPLRGPPI